MNKLRAVITEANRGNAQVVVVSGEPGIGKSRLLSEFRSIIELEGVRCVAVAMQPHDANRPVGAFVDLVPQLLRLPGSLGSSPESMAALRRLTGASHSEQPESTEESELDSIAWAVTAAIGDLCESIAAESPLALVIEDAHSIDQFSLNALSSLMSNRRTARIVALLSTREPRPLLRSFRHSDKVTSLPVKPLAAEMTGVLIDDALSMIAPLTPETRARLVELANGNPLFALSLANHYRETGDGTGVPITLIDSIGRRVDSLSTNALSVLTACIALGKHCTTDRIIRSLDLNAINLLNSLHELTEFGVMTDAADQISPIHPLVAEIVPIRSLPAARRVVNAKVAEVFEHDARLHQSPAYWWEAGTLWRHAGNADRALAAYRACARHAMDIGRPAEAAHILNEALVIGDPNERTIAAARELMIAADLSSETGIVLRGYSILERAGALNDHDEFELAARRALMRETELPGQVFELTLRCIQDPNTTPEHRVLAAILGLKSAEVGETAAQMVEMLSNNLPASDLSIVEDVIRLEFELLVRAVRDEWEGACEVAERLSAAAEHKRPARQAAILHNCGIAFSLGGRPQAAIDAWQRAYETVVTARTPSQQGRLAALLAGIHADLADDSEWDFWIARASEAFERSPGYRDSFDLSVIQMCRALVVGDLAEFECLMAKVDQSGAFLGSPTRERWGRAFVLFLKTWRQELSPDDLVAAKLLLRPDTRIFSGIRDFEIAAAAGILATEDRQGALSAIRHYVATERRTRQLLDRLLSVAIQQLEADETAGAFHRLA
jgi:hypothetical protein